MKKHLLTLVLSLLAMQEMVAQQIPLLCQNHYTMFFYNPAFVGTYTNPQLYYFNRNRWTDIPDEPRTNGIAFTFPLKKDVIGLGGYLTQDNFGVFHNTNVRLDFSYDVKLGDSINLFLGYGAGFTDAQIFYVTKTLGTLTDYLRLNCIGGIVVNWKHLNVGVSVPQLFNNILTTSLASTSNPNVLYNVRHFIGTVDYLFPIKKNFTLKTIYILQKGGRNIPIQHDVCAVASYKDHYWVSLGFHSSYDMAGGLGIRLFNHLTLGYAHDFNNSSASPFRDMYAGQINEIIIGYRFGKKLNK